MQSLLTRWADALLAWLGLTSALNNGWDRWVAFALVVLSVVLLDFLCRTVLVRGIRRIVMRTKATWDDELFSSAVLSRLCNIVSAIVLVIVLPVVFDEQSEARTIVTRLIQVYIVVTVFRFINALLYAAFNIVSARPAWQNKPIYTPHIDCGDYVIVTNASKIKVTGKKLDQKIYYSHSDYVGGMKETTLREMLEKKPEKVIELAVKGMLPKGPLGRSMITKLHVYAGPDHEQAAQKPEVLEIKF